MSLYRCALIAALFALLPLPPVRAVALNVPVSSTNLLAPGPVGTTTEIRLTDWETGGRNWRRGRGRGVR